MDVRRWVRSDKPLILAFEFFEAAWKLSFVYGVVWSINHKDYGSAAASFMLFLILMDARGAK